MLEIILLLIFIPLTFLTSAKKALIIIAIFYIAFNITTLATTFKKLKRLFAGMVIPHYLWIPLFTSMLLWSQASLNTFTNPFAITNIAKVVQVAIPGLIGLFLFMLRMDAVGHFLNRIIGPMVLYAIVTAVSTLYASHSMYALWKSMSLFVDIFVLAVFLTYKPFWLNTKKLFDLKLTLFAMLLGMAWLGGIFAPSSAFIKTRGLIHYSLMGIMPIINPDGIGYIGALVSIVSFLRMLDNHSSRDRIFYRIIFILGIASLIFSQARTSLVAFSITLIISLLIKKKVGWIITIGLIAILFMLNLSASHYLQQYFIRGQSKELLMSLSGRTHLWAYAWKRFKSSPIIGYGYGSGVRFDILHGSSTVSLHGAIFDVLIGVGLLGFVPWVTALACTWQSLISGYIRFRRKMNKVERNFHIEVMAVMFISSIRATTSSVMVVHDQSMLLLFCIMAYASQLNGLKYEFSKLGKTSKQKVLKEIGHTH